MPRPSNFTDRQKAELFVRDCATCAYTGRNLWLLDHGCHPHYQVDWADHLVPVSNGGLSSLENGVCASWAANYRKSNRENTHVVHFVRGAPTAAYLREGNKLTAGLKRYFKGFSTLHYSDWYFNRALFRLWLGVVFLSRKGSTRTRDDTYYAKASFTILKKWKRIVTTEKVSSLEKRGLMPVRITPEHQLLLSVRYAMSVQEIRTIMGQLLPHFLAHVSRKNRGRG